MADTKYLNYGDQQIDYNALLTSMANEVPQYIQSQPWSNKRKQRVMNAYTDLVTNGINGASNTTGQWTIDVGGNIDFSSKSSKDMEAYQEAAYIIQQQMSKIPTVSQQKEELPVFDNKYFTENFNNHIGHKMFGGQNWSVQEHWNTLDERGENGLRGRTNRANALADRLEEYSKSLKEGEHNFEGSPFTDLNDFKTRVGEAIRVLRTEDIKDDAPALNAIGLNPKEWFYDGSGDEFSKDGYVGTYGGYYNEYLPELEKQKAAKQAEEQKQRQAQVDAYIQSQRAKPRMYALRSKKLLGNLLTATDLADKYGNTNTLKDKLLQYQQKGLNNLTTEENTELISAYTLGAKDNISDDEWNALRGVAFLKGANRNRFKKINGIDNLVFDTVGKRVIHLYNENIQQQQDGDFLKGQSSKELQNLKKLKDEDWDTIGADVVSMLGDIVSLGGGYAGVAGGVTTILSDLYADVKRGKDFWDVAKNLAKNAAWGFAGLIPGAKLARLGKRAAQLYALCNSFGIAFDPDVHKSWQKLINGEDFSSHDFENLKWTLHAITGAHNTVRSHFSDKALQGKINTGKVEVQTKTGKKRITLQQQKEINKAGGRGGQKAANDKFKDIVGEEAKENSFSFNTEGRKWYNPTRYSQTLRNAVSDEKKLEGTPTTASKMTIGRILAEDKNKPWLLANPFSKQTYKDWWTGGGPLRGYNSMALGKIYQQQNNTKQNNTPLQQNNTTQESSQQLTSVPHSKNEIRRDWKNTIEKGKFSNNEITTGDYKVGHFNIKVSKTNDGKYRIHTDVYSSDAHGPRPESPSMKPLLSKFESQKEVQREIAKIVKESRRRANISDIKGNKAGINHKEIGKILRDLKAKGWLKQGGQLTSEQLIDKYLK